jgi:hypothetical protein
MAFQCEVRAANYTPGAGAKDSRDAGAPVALVLPVIGPFGQRPSNGNWLMGIPSVNTCRSSSVSQSSIDGTVSSISVLVNQAEGL